MELGSFSCRPCSLTTPLSHFLSLYTTKCTTEPRAAILHASLYLTFGISCSGGLCLLCFPDSCFAETRLYISSGENVPWWALKTTGKHPPISFSLR